MFTMMTRTSVYITIVNNTYQQFWLSRIQSSILRILRQVITFLRCVRP